MGEVWVVNASPIISLSRAGHLRLVTELAEQVLVPEAVALEVLAGSETDPARRALESGWGKRVLVEQVPAAILEWSLGAGESHALAVAQAKQGSTVVLDDAEGRRCARTLGVPLLGTLGIVVRAKKRGRVQSAAQVLRDLLDAGFHLEEGLISDILRRAVGEEWKR
jgi:hypothetical protein